MEKLSILIAGVGLHWLPGCKEAVLAMAKHTAGEGHKVTFHEEPDRCYRRFDAIGTMRNNCYMKALEGGYQYVLYVDNDVAPLPEALSRLLARGVPVISPLLRYAQASTAPLPLATLTPGSGLALVTSVPLSMVLFRATVFLPWALSPFWQDALGADEEYHFQRLALTGHQPFVDTDVAVDVLALPHYPLDEKKEEEAY